LDSATFARRLLDWFAARRRELPWRADTEPYRVWVSEIMLQQTRVEAVVPFYERWMARFPDVAALAAADEQEVLRHWAGLGYYRRARMLHAAARELVAAGGGLPRDRAGWRALPGVGDYTSAAIASIALGERAAVVDGNVKRVAARWRALELAADDRRLHRAAEEWGEGLLAHAAVPGDLNQALMELGATVCTPRAPRCEECPVAAGCAATDPLAHPLPPKPKAWKEVELHFVVAAHGPLRLLEQKSGGWTPGLWEPPARADDDARELVPLGSARHVITRHRITAHAHRWDGWDGAGGVRPSSVPLSGLGRKLLRLLAEQPGG
jgi:A/G-specific adenine glycosylase